jgi:hypothetical protein
MRFGPQQDFSNAIQTLRVNDLVVEMGVSWVEMAGDWVSLA